MKIRLIAFVCVVALLVLGGCSRKEPPDPVIEMQGEWVVREMTEKGKPADARRLKNLNVSVRGHEFSRVEADGPKLINAEQTTLRCDPKAPGHVDFVGMMGADQGKTRLGIYRLEGATLQICMAEAGAARPTEFAGKETSTLLVLERKQQ